MKPACQPAITLRVAALFQRAFSPIATSLKRKTSRLLDRLQGRRPVHFLHIRKTGGTAVKHALSSHCRTPHHAIQLHDHATTLRDLPPGEGVIFFLRDPVSRFVSGFYSRQRQGQPHWFYPWSPEETIAFAEFKTPNQLASALSSVDEELHGKAIAAMHSINHLRSFYWDWFGDESYFLSRKADILFVGFLETMQRDFETLKEKLGLPPELALPDSPVEMHQNPQGLDKRLDPQAIDNLKQWYRRDYQFIAVCRSLCQDNP